MNDDYVLLSGSGHREVRICLRCNGLHLKTDFEISLHHAITQHSTIEVIEK